MGLFNHPALIFLESAGSDKDGSLFGSFLWWFWYSVVQKIYSLIVVFMESKLTVFSLMPPLFFHLLSFYYPLVEILIKVIFKSPFSKICLKQGFIFRPVLSISNANPEQ